MLIASFVILCIFSAIGFITVIVIISKMCNDIVKQKRKTLRALEVMRGYKYKGNEWKCSMQPDDIAEAELYLNKLRETDVLGFIYLEDHEGGWKEIYSKACGLYKRGI